MRKCIRCGNEMTSNYDIKVDAQGYGIKITESGVFGNTIQKPKIAICPVCGEVSLYIEDTAKLKELHHGQK